MKKRKQQSQFKHVSLFFSYILTIIVIFSAVTYSFHNSYMLTYDSSEDGSEIVDQVTIPKDVQIAIQKQKLTFNANRSVLGAQINKPISVPILMYHYVEYVQDKNDTKRISLNTTPYTLEDEIKTLISAHYTFMTHKELTNVLQGRAVLPTKPIVLTFDDGYRDFYTDAYPILKKYHVKATQYVITGFLEQPNHMTKAQVQEIANDGLVEIGSHTVHHVWLKDQTLKNVIDETTQSKADLENLIHQPVVSFAYPYGAFDQQAVEVVEKSYQSAVSTVPGIQQSQENKYFLFRLRPGGRTGKDLLTWLEEQK